MSALVNGYTVKKAPVWVVRELGRYVYKVVFDEKEDKREMFYTEKDNALKFTDKAKAEAVATLTGGTVEEWSE